VRCNFDYKNIKNRSLNIASEVRILRIYYNLHIATELENVIIYEVLDRVFFTD